MRDVLLLVDALELSEVAHVFLLGEEFEHGVFFEDLNFLGTELGNSGLLGGDGILELLVLLLEFVEFG